MAISFRCEHCHRQVSAPDASAGKRGKCPFCGQSSYIPAPVAEEEILDLAPLDEQEERRRQAEIEALRQKERALLSGSGEEEPVPLEQRGDLTSADLEHLVVNYCLDMYGSKLDRLAAHLRQLRRFPTMGLQAVEDFLAGKAREQALDFIPPRTLQAFLTQLRDELRKGR